MKRKANATYHINKIFPGVVIIFQPPKDLGFLGTSEYKIRCKRDQIHKGFTLTWQMFNIATLKL